MRANILPLSFVLLCAAHAAQAASTTRATAGADVGFENLRASSHLNPGWGQSAFEMNSHAATAGVSLPGGQEAASASAYADFGVLKVEAFANRGAARPAPDSDSTTPQEVFAGGGATARFSEDFTLANDALNGRTAQVLMSIAVDGFLDAHGSQASQINLTAVATGASAVGGGFEVRLTDSASGGPSVFETGLANDEMLIDPSGSVFINAVQDIFVTFTMGSTFNLTVTLNGSVTSASSPGSAGNLVPGVGELNFFNTALWAGMRDLRVRNPVTNSFELVDLATIDLIGGSGVDWRAPMPEPVPLPASALLLLSGVATLAARRRR